MAAPRKPSSNKPNRSILIVTFLIVIGLVLWFSRDDKHEGHNAKDKHGHSAEEHAEQTSDRSLRKNFAARAHREGEPKGDYQYVYDRGANGSFLIAKKLASNYLPNSDVRSGRDLWIQDSAGNERLVASNVSRARFSPDGSKIAYGTSDAVVKVETLDGSKLAEIDRASEPSWRSDSGAFAYVHIPEGRPLANPEVLQLATYDMASGQTKYLTDGKWDDVRPEYHPSGEWVLFVSGGRTGLASFWKVPVNGGEPVQITNTGMEQVNDLFVPPPYDRALWSQDKRWLVYDYKNGDVEQTWGLEFDESGNFKQAIQFGEGIDPKWNADKQSFTSVKHTETNAEKVEYKLPTTTNVANN